MSQASNSTGVARTGRYTLDPRAQFAYLAREWAMIFQPSSIPADLAAAVAVALVALPLSLAIATASGVEPAVGLITAIVGGVAVALFGGCRLQVSGPAAAMTFLVYEIIVKYGHSGLIVATLLAGLLQVVSGVFRLGRFIQFIPRPVVAGFLSGIGLTILCTQLPVVLGYDVTHDEEGGAISLLAQTLRRLGQTNPHAVLVGAATVGTMIILPRISRRLPTPLLAVAAGTVLPIAMGWEDLRLLGPLPREFPRPTLPAVPWYEWNELVLASFTIYLLASIESLLSAAVVDSMDKKTRVDNDQELVGQGIGNIASALFGGLPVTGVIARSATNIQSGARTRLSAIAHAGVILASMMVLGAVVARIPRAALSGVLIAVALRMIEVRMLKTLWRGSRPEAFVFLVTVGAILITDLIDGVQIGLIATVLYFVYEMSNLQIQPVPLQGQPNGDETSVPLSCPYALVVEAEGPLFFASGFFLRNLSNQIRHEKFLVIDMAGVPFLDVTGAEILEEEVEHLNRRGVEVLLTRPVPSVRRRLRTLAETEFNLLMACPVFETTREALAFVARGIEANEACDVCRQHQKCSVLDEMLKLSVEGGQRGAPHVPPVKEPRAEDAAASH